MRRKIVTAGLVASVAFASGAAFAAPCGPAVLASVDGRVLVNRGAGFLSGAAGMPLSVGDYVMSRGGSAQIAYANGSAASLSGAKSMPITACSADAGNLTDPALAQFGGATPTGGWNVVPPAGNPAPVGGVAGGTGGVAGGAGGAVGGISGSAAAAGTAGTAAAGSIGVGAAAAAAGVAAAAAVGVAVAASSTSSNNTPIITVSP